MSEIIEKTTPSDLKTLPKSGSSKKSNSKVKPKTIQSYKILSTKLSRCGDSAISKQSAPGDVEDFLLANHRDRRTKKRISHKTRHNMKSCLHQFFTWVYRRENPLNCLNFPEIEFELGWRNIVTIEVQQAIIQEVKRISFGIEPKIWLGIKLLATYIKIRPGEMRNVRERDINLESGFIHIPHPKEGSRKNGKFAYLDIEDVELIKSFPTGHGPGFVFLPAHGREVRGANWRAVRAQNI